MHWCCKKKKFVFFLFALLSDSDFWKWVVIPAGCTSWISVKWHCGQLSPLTLGKNTLWWRWCNVTHGWEMWAVICHSSLQVPMEELWWGDIPCIAHNSGCNIKNNAAIPTMIKYANTFGSSREKPSLMLFCHEFCTNAGVLCFRAQLFIK